MVEAVLNGKIIEEYPDEQRVLICGQAALTESIQIYLHVICEYADPVYTEFVTAYLPDESQWQNPPFRRRRNTKKQPMENKPDPICNVHQRPREWRQATFEYSEDGVSIRVPGVYAWVCPVDGEASFTPETVDELITTVRELLEPAKRARARRSVLTEYIVSVSSGDQIRPAA